MHPLVTLLIIIVLIVLYSKYISNKKKKKQVLLTRVRNFVPTSKFVEDSGRFVISVDKKNKKVAIIISESQKYCFKKDEIIDIDIILDTETGLKGATPGVIIGGLIGGVKGSAIGGLITSNIKTKVKNVYLHLTISRSPNNINLPFMREAVKQNVNSILVKEAYERASMWKDKINSL